MNQTIVSVVAVWGLLLSGFFVWLLIEAWRSTPKTERIVTFLDKTYKDLRPYRVGKGDRGAHRTKRANTGQKK